MNDSYFKIVALRILPGIAVGMDVYVGWYGLAAGLATTFLLLAIGGRK